MFIKSQLIRFVERLGLGVSIYSERAVFIDIARKLV